MKLTKKKKRVLILAAAASVCLAAAVTIGFLFRKTDPVKNEFIGARVTCQVAEVFDGAEKSSITVKNTGSTDAFIRLRLISYWVDGDGKILGKPSQMPTVAYASDSWAKGSEDTYYYCKPVPPGSSTGELLTSPIRLSESTYEGERVYQTVEVFAEAIQSDPLRGAESSWHVTTKNGEILTAP